MNSVGRPCTVCSHAERAKVEEAILADEPLRAMARRFKLSTGALIRHRSTHMTNDMRLAAERLEDAAIYRGGTLLERMAYLNQEAQMALQAAKAARDTRLTLQAIGTASRLLELQAKLQGEIGEGGTTITITHNDFRSLQVNIVAALERFPEAKAAVLRALAGEPPAPDGAGEAVLESEPAAYAEEDIR
ncbi:MAG: hypothetical protein AB7F35_29115 [Acetobacteraceae bacterium]